MTEKNKKLSPSSDYMHIKQVQCSAVHCVMLLLKHASDGFCTIIKGIPNKTSLNDKDSTPSKFAFACEILQSSFFLDHTQYFILNTLIQLMYSRYLLIGIFKS